MAKFMNMDKKLIDISKDEVLRYLGYRNQKLSNDMESLMDETIEEAKEIIRPRYTYRYFDLTVNEENILLETNKNHIFLKDKSIIGKDIVNHLSFSKGCYLLAATLGIEIDKKIIYYEKTNLTKALILDACGTAIVENICDFVCKLIKSKLIKNKFSITSRYSPGYGDFSIDIQGEFLKVIDGERSIGLTATKDNILIPRKSVTAVVGVIDEILDNEPYEKCESCLNYSECTYRKEGDRCES